MHRLRTIAATAFGAALIAGSAGAQSLRNVDGPAEIPPASYTANQYVDSNGCVFIRAGFDGAVTWVPRVDRQRKVLCGFSPSLAGADLPPANAAPPARPVVAELPPPSAPPRSTTPPPAATPVVAAPPPVRVTAPPPTVRVTAPPPKVVAPPPTVTAAPPPGGVTTVCPGLSPLAQRHVQNSGHAVRCGPQGASPYVRGDASGAIHVPQPPVITPPPGYKAAFDDGRFNPNRGHVTREGFIQMRLVWTAGVPRRLVTENTEKYRVVNGVPTSDREFVISTKNATPETALPAGHRFVQVGLFSTEAKARAAAAGLQARGLPVRLGSATQGGKPYSVVLAGPFADPAALGTGLNAVRGIGYTGAFTRQ